MSLGIHPSIRQPLRIGAQLRRIPGDSCEDASSGNGPGGERRREAGENNMPKLTLDEGATILPAKAKSTDGAISHWSTVLFMGGQTYAENPEKLVGHFSMVEIKVDVSQQAQSWKRTSGESGAMISTGVRPLKITAVKK